MNSLRSLSRAIDYEAARQVELVEAGGRVVQETRGWNEVDGRTHSMRSKEEAFDYRYFPEPDLVPVIPEEAWLADVASALPPLPAARRARVAAAAGLAPDADAVVTVVRLDLDDLVAAAVDAGADAALAVKRLANEVAAGLDQGHRPDPHAFSRVVLMEGRGELTSAQARTVLKELLERGGDADEIVARLGFEPMAGDAVDAAIDEAIAANQAEWDRFVAGEDKLQGLFVGKVKVATGGRADLKAVAASLHDRRRAAVDTG
jgi:aspartyl-tRNA(Asn)/glutamyl-tRNA(Gln) amidotransferase subunit B